MRCLLILRVPSILANLLSCRLEMHGELEADGKELTDRCTTAEALSDAVHALFYVSAPNDASRVRCVLLSLWDAELRRHLETVEGEQDHATGRDGGAADLQSAILPFANPCFLYRGTSKIMNIFDYRVRLYTSLKAIAILLNLSTTKMHTDLCCCTVVLWCCMLLK